MVSNKDKVSVWPITERVTTLVKIAPQPVGSATDTSPFTVKGEKPYGPREKYGPNSNRGTRKLVNAETRVEGKRQQSKSMKYLRQKKSLLDMHG
jgi:hypothetical protein